jgi:hypothetical protein
MTCPRSLSSPPPDATSSGYSSAAEFYPIDDEDAMSTDDYELYNPRLRGLRHVRPPHPSSSSSSSAHLPSSQQKSLTPNEMAMRNRARLKKNNEVRVQGGACCV